MQIFTKEQALPLASSTIDGCDPAAFANAFSVNELVTRGLADLLVEDPIETLTKLQSLPLRGRADAAAEVGTAGTVAAQASALPPKPAPAPQRKAPPLEEQQALVRQLLKRQHIAARKDICEAANISGAYAYHRLMTSMKGELKAKGQRSKRIYSLR